MLFPRTGWSHAVCPVFLNRQLYLACAGDDGTVRLWDPHTGKPRRHRIGRRWWRRGPRGHGAPVSALCAIPSRGGTRLVSASHDGTVRVWNLVTRRQEVAFEEHRGRVRAACALVKHGQDLVASAGDDLLIRVWDARTGEQRHVLQGHTGRITAICPVPANGRTVLASTSLDGTVRIWDPTTGTLELTIPVHHEATACVAAADRLVVGLSAGTLAITLDL
jgi:WD40 repeat protein